MSITIKEALHIAINLLEQQPTTKQNKQAIKLLSNLTNRDYFVKWNKSLIISTLDEWIKEHDRVPTVRDLTETGMPKAVVIQKHFGVSASVFLKQQYGHLIPKTERRNKYGFNCQEDWINCFRTQFLKHNRPKCKQYNLVKDECTPQYETIIRHSGVSSWTELLKVANVCYLKSNAEINKICIRKSNSDIIQRYEKAVAKQERLDKELMETIKNNKP